MSLNVESVAHELESASSPPLAPRATRDDHAANARAMNTYEAKLRDEGCGLPAWPQNPDRIHWAALAREVGIAYLSLVSKKCPHRPRVEQWKDRFGLTVRPGVLSLGHFAEIAVRHRMAEFAAASTDISSQAIDDLRRTFTLLIAEFSQSADVTEALRDDPARQDRYDETCQREIARCREYLQGWARNEDLPANPVDLLRYAMIRRNVTPHIIADACGGHQKTWRNWLNGTMPAAVNQSAIAKAEEFLKLPALSLTTRFASALAEQDARPDTLSWAVECRWRQSHPYRLYDWSERLEAEFAKFTHFRTTLLLPYGLRRRGGPWRKKTIVTTWKRCADIFGTWCSDMNPSFQMEPADCSFGYFVFGRLIHNRIEFIKDRMTTAKRLVDKSADVDPEEGFLSRWELDCLEALEQLLHPEFGWITQTPELATHLKPLYGRNGETIVSPEEIENAKKNWVGVCVQAHAEVIGFRKTSGKTRISRDPHDGVVPILEMSNPFVAFDLFCFGLQEDAVRIAAEDPRSHDHGYALRDVVLGGLMTQTALRRSTLNALDLDNLMFVAPAGKWLVRIPRRKFKNPDGPFFWANKNTAPMEFYERFLVDQYGLYAAIDGYLTWARSKILRGAQTDALLVCAPAGRRSKRPREDWSEPGRATCHYLNRLLHRLTRRHVAYNSATGKGIRGVKSFGPHAFRHILATGVMKMTEASKQLQAAADAIHDGIEAVMGYLRYRPKDREKTLQTGMAHGFAGAVAQRTAA